MHLHACRVDHRHWVGAHFACARRVVGRFAIARHPVEDLLVALHLWPGRELAAVEFREGGLAQNVARAANGLDPLAAVLRGREVVEAQGRVLARVGRFNLYGTTRVGVHRADMHLVAVATLRHGAVVADGEWQEMEHQVRVIDILVAAHKAARLEMVGGGRAAPEEQPLEADPGLVVPEQRGIG